MARYLFVSCMNNSGSTLLVRYLARCANAVCMEREGQSYVPHAMPGVGKLGVQRIWSEAAKTFEDPANYDWFAVKAAWIREWSSDPKSATAQDPVYIEKSPPDLLRVDMLQREFPPASFLVMVRNPYAVAEGIRRRRGYDIERCVRHWMYCTRRQIRNIEQLERSVWFSYEELCARPERVREKIVELVPQLDDLSFRGPLGEHPGLGLPPAELRADLNERQIDALDPRELRHVSDLLSNEPELCRYFGYRILSTSRGTAD